MTSRFFRPYVGKLYNQGIRGKKVLVLGASFYCPKVQCPFYKECTNVVKKCSSLHDKDCPSYASLGQHLSDEPSFSVSDSPETYVRFAKALFGYVGAFDYQAVWDRVAFTNYVQFFLPGDGESFRPTIASDLSERDFKAFVETVKEIKPDVIVVWGCVINSSVKGQNPYVYDKELLPQNDWYLCHMKIPGITGNIAIVNPNHPSSSAWYADLDMFGHYFLIALNE